MKKFIFLFAMTVLIVSGHANAAKLHFAEGEWVPYVSQDLHNNGVSAEIVSAALQAVGLDVEYSFYPWKRSLIMVEKGAAVGSFPWSKTPERAKVLLYSDPIHSTREVLFYLKDRFPDGVEFNALPDLSSYVFGGTRGYWYEDYFIKHGLNVDYVADPETSFMKLEKGRVDFVPENELVGWSYLRKLFPGNESKFSATRKAYRSEKMYVIFNKKNGRVPRNRFNEGLRIIRKNGIYDAILKKYNLK